MQEGVAFKSIPSVCSIFVVCVFSRGLIWCAFAEGTALCLGFMCGTMGSVFLFWFVEDCSRGLVVLLK